MWAVRSERVLKCFTRSRSPNLCESFLLGKHSGVPELTLSIILASYYTSYLHTENKKLNMVISALKFLPSCLTSFSSFPTY